MYPKQLLSYGVCKNFLNKKYKRHNFAANKEEQPFLCVTRRLDLIQSELPRPIPWNSVESDLGCTSRV